MYVQQLVHVSQILLNLWHHTGILTSKVMTPTFVELSDILSASFNIHIREVASRTMLVYKSKLAKIGWKLVLEML